MLFFKKWFQPKVVDPEAVDEVAVRRYIKVHKRFNREYHGGSWNSINNSRELYDQLQRIRATSNRATNRAINVAFDLPEDFMLGKPLERGIILTMSTN